MQNYFISTWNSSFTPYLPSCFTLHTNLIKQSKTGITEDEMVGWHHWLDGNEFEQAQGVGDGQGSLACYSPWGHKELDITEWLNWLTDITGNKWSVWNLERKKITYSVDMLNLLFGCPQQLQLYDHSINHRIGTAIHPNITGCSISNRKLSFISKIKV